MIKRQDVFGKEVVQMALLKNGLFCYRTGSTVLRTSLMDAE